MGKLRIRVLDSTLRLYNLETPQKNIQIYICQSKSQDRFLPAFS